VSNPIVGRIAFWTDDETCKVNINTASEGTYWDTPRSRSKQDIDFANYQPAQKEFQRYPGHPTMTSLAPVFFATSSINTPTLTKPQRDALYSVAPRIVGGGSDAGSVIATVASTPDSDRLYASVDELMFAMPTGLVTRPGQDPSAAITADKVRQRAFFLTASSRAPEITLFNTPRVAMWPVHKLNPDGTTNPTRTTAYDRLIAFCSTIGGQPYFFQRENAKSPTNDWANIPRNRDILRYLQALSGRNLPGFGASLVSKTTAADRDQLLVSMLDYVRSTNLYDDNLIPNTYDSQATADSAVQFTVGRRSASVMDSYDGHGIVAPLRVPAGLADGISSNSSTLMGFGRFQTISEAGMLFICNADGKNGTFKARLDNSGTPMAAATVPSVDQLARMISNVPPGTLPADRTFGYFLNQSANSSDFNNQAPVVTVAPGTTNYPVNNMLNVGAPLGPNQRRIQMMLFFDLFSPMQGWTRNGVDGSFDVEFTGDFLINGMPLGMVSGEVVNLDRAGAHSHHAWGGAMGYRKVFSTNAGTRHAPARGAMPADSASSNTVRRYGLVSAPITITVPSVAAPTMSFTGPSKLLVKFYSRPLNTGRAVNRSAADLVQTIELNFPNTDFPIPVLKTVGTKTERIDGVISTLGTVMETWWALNYAGALSGLPLRPGTPPAAPPGYSSASLVGRFRYLGSRPNDTAGTLIQSSDTLRTLVPYHGDIRLVAGAHEVPAGVFQPSTFYFDTTRNDNVQNALSYGGGSVSATAPPQIQSYITSSGNAHSDSYAGRFRPAVADRLVAGAGYNLISLPKFPGIAVSNSDRRSARPFQQWGDFDNGVASTADGAYINKPDEGNIARSGAGDIPYFSKSYQQAAGGPTFFSPNRQVSGPGMFGSLPTRMRTGNQGYDSDAPLVNVNNTWRTLLLRPQIGHPGAADPPDHLWTDLFWMPVVEPYAISEPFSTAGKINMNYAIEPFRYIERKTAMAALLRAEKIPAIATSNAPTYKSSLIATPTTTPTRLDLDIAETLKQWDAKFSGNEVFVSSTQLCDMHLVPQGQNVAGMPAFWTTHGLTGDNSRERPYTNLLGRLTTKSNTYTVHYRVQALKQPPNSKAGEWDETRGVVTGEYRGSTTIERYITPKDTTIPDYAAAASLSAPPSDLGTFYKWRTLNTRQFAP
jgi:uncharacterized protein (TIGR02600 family)